MNCPRCGCDTFELKSDTHDLCSYLVTINDDGEITREESLREEVGDTEPHGNVVCGECGLNLRVGTWEVLEPGKMLFPYTVLMRFPRYFTTNETYLSYVYAQDAKEAEKLARSELEASRPLTSQDFKLIGVFRGHIYAEIADGIS